MRRVAQEMRRVAQEMRNERWDSWISESVSTATWTRRVPEAVIQEDPALLLYYIMR